MKLAFWILVASLVAFVGAKTTWDRLEDYSFDDYVHEFNKRYSSDTERTLRRSIFQTRLNDIRAHNRRADVNWKRGVNHLTDRTDAEFRRLLGSKKSLLYATREKLAPEPAAHLSVLDSLPSEVDWRLKGVVTPVKDQGDCGSCWAFGSASTIESYYAIATGLLATLSEQQILDCALNPNDCGGTGGCGGGDPAVAFAKIIQMGGLASEWTYPYISYHRANSTCKFSNSTTPPVAVLSSFVNLPPNQYLPVMASVANTGPLAINVDASAWQSYEGGVFTGCAVNPDINHVVQLVGYGTDPKEGDYWLVRNSWTPSWGEGGYIRLARSANVTCGIDSHPQDGTGCNGGPSKVQVCGACGLLYATSYPVIAK